MEFKAGGFSDNLFFAEPSKEQPILVGSILNAKLIPATKEQVIESVRQAILEAGEPWVK